MSEKDRYKVAYIIKDVVDKYLSLDLSDFEDEESAKIFDALRKNPSFHAMSDYENLMSSEKTHVTNTLYPQVLFSLKDIQLSLVDSIDDRIKLL